MNNSIFNKLQSLRNRYQEIEILLTQKNIFSNREQLKILSQEYLKLSDIMKYFIKWEELEIDIKNIRSLFQDVEMQDIAQEELCLFNKKKKKLEEKIYQLLLPEDPNDKNSCFIEIRSATGGDESCIFAGELFRMYTRYSESYSWKVEVMHTSEGEKGGFKEIIAKITGKGVCGRLKFESGGHRVQRVPETESQGRIHTSTCTVAIMPVTPKTEKEEINLSDLKIDTFRSSGAGGQHVNTTDSAIRITHVPTGHVVECQDERSQHKNKAKALSILSARVYSAKLEKDHEKNASMRRLLLGSGERSDRNRTYNFAQNRITDHRIHLTIYKLDEVLQGKLDLLIEPIIREYQADMLSSLSKSE
ncbi:peptide chain release factor 1 [Buchnera aphidicola]|uniref:Peptide chain release factor 1 n=1 Tax=Buchnera aphidicola str. USDA (Myzus persicae) TaxID=1009856 RepID=W0P0C8_BUCMP|nr:peptide chain release factor 1 [Buchnera aphidicola]AHG60201.1 Prfa [Buchnera aphidicola str. USDA (Myzus persicae)]AHG60779.1 Prfa [Buchnera aphidicola str. W106 (Myzus persicae)]AHG61351.1 Prfa [Buchnera aphidicola str. G002 (Myzus persicae)]AHG61924.1 Prfa [Buchnera aphidicola str. F009 (Myzus persicae)]WAI03112.1 MAG: peptide chain release factor 1 [Buchnera aphidicola (Myzus persicae)]